MISLNEILPRAIFTNPNVSFLSFYFQFYFSKDYVFVYRKKACLFMVQNKETLLNQFKKETKIFVAFPLPIDNNVQNLPAH